MTGAQMINRAPELAWRGMRRLLRPARNIIFRPQGRSANAYATHVPVLIGLAHTLNIKRIMEYGCGQYSTLTFLNRSAYPHLVELRSFENDVEWAAKMADLVGDDPRLRMAQVNGPMAQSVSRTELDGYDLIFIDDSTGPAERAATIREIAAEHLKSTVVVIHDYEVQIYRQSASAFENHFRFDCLNPHTGVAWNNASLDRRQLKHLHSLIKKHAKALPHDDVNGWLQIFSACRFS